MHLMCELLMINWFVLISTVAYTNDHVSFHWKWSKPITIFNKELAEFDMDKWEIEEINQTYVAG